MLRAFALLTLLLAAFPAAAETLPFGLGAAEAPICRAVPASIDGACGPLQLAAATCSQTCYDDQNNCRSGCERANRGASGTSANRDKCVAACTTTYGRCQTRCSANK